MVVKEGTKNKMYDVITVGSALSDIFVDTGLREVKRGERKIMAYPVGYKIAVKDIKFSIGGGGTNTAVGFARMGLKTGYLGKIGNDDAAKEIIKSLKHEKVDFLGKQENAISGHSIILDSFEHNRTILTFKGPSDDLKISDVHLKELKTKWIYLASAMHETLKTQEKLAEYAKKNLIKVAFNPSEYEVKLGIKKLNKILMHTDLLVFNRDEASILTGKKDINDIFTALKKFAIDIICITDGDKMIHAYYQNRLLKLKPHKIKVVDMTGAGDALASGFLSAIIKTNDVKLALKVGLANSQAVIKHYGAKNKLLTWREALQEVKKIH
jgi:ribokinase